MHHVLETGARRQLTVAPMAFRDSQPQRLTRRNHGGVHALRRWAIGAPRRAVVWRRTRRARRLEQPERRADVDPRRPRDPGGAAGDERQAAGATEGRVARAGGAVGWRSTRIAVAIGLAFSRWTHLPARRRQRSAGYRTSPRRSAGAPAGRHDHEQLAVLRCHPHGHAGTVFSGWAASRVRIGPERQVSNSGSRTWMDRRCAA